MKKLLLVTFISIAMFSKSQDVNYFEKYQPLADSFESIYGVPSSLMLAIAYLESAGGKSKLAVNSNNHFGIKGKNGFRKYESDTASYESFCVLVYNKSFYKRLLNETDPVKWVYALSNANYAGGSNTWPGKVISIISRNELD